MATATATTVTPPILFTSPSPSASASSAGNTPPIPQHPTPTFGPVAPPPSSSSTTTTTLETTTTTTVPTASASSSLPPSSSSEQHVSFQSPMSTADFETMAAATHASVRAYVAAADAKEAAARTSQHMTSSPPWSVIRGGGGRRTHGDEETNYSDEKHGGSKPWSDGRHEGHVLPTRGRTDERQTMDNPNEMYNIEGVEKERYDSQHGRPLSKERMVQSRPSGMITGRAAIHSDRPSEMIGGGHHHSTRPKVESRLGGHYPIQNTRLSGSKMSSSGGAIDRGSGSGDRASHHRDGDIRDIRDDNGDRDHSDYDRDDDGRAGGGVVVVGDRNGKKETRHGDRHGVTRDTMREQPLARVGERPTGVTSIRRIPSKGVGNVTIVAAAAAASSAHRRQVRSVGTTVESAKSTPSDRRAGGIEEFLAYMQSKKSHFRSSPTIIGRSSAGTASGVVGADVRNARMISASSSSLSSSSSSIRSKSPWRGGSGGGGGGGGVTEHASSSPPSVRSKSPWRVADTDISPRHGRHSTDTALVPSEPIGRHRHVVHDGGGRGGHDRMTTDRDRITDRSGPSGTDGYLSDDMATHDRNISEAYREKWTTRHGGGGGGGDDGDSGGGGDGGGDGGVTRGGGGGTR